MSSLGKQPDLVLTICTYRAYFSLPGTHPFSGGYEAVLDPYRIELINAAAVQTPASVSQKNLHGQSTRRPYRLPPVACDARARQGSGPRPHIPHPLRQLLHQSDGKTALKVGRRDICEPRRRVLQDRALGGVGPHVPSLRLGRLCAKRRRHRQVSLRRREHHAVGTLWCGRRGG